MKIMVGLGNPGKEYEKTRHNAGWMIMDELAAGIANDNFRENKKMKSLVAEGEYAGEKILLIKPLTYMNLSGEAVQTVMSFYKAQSTDIWVIYDDLDLPTGQLRIRKEGGAGTHNGMRSIVQHIGQNFSRFRIGIEGRNEDMKGKTDAASYVLSPFSAPEKEKIKKCIKDGVDAIKIALEKGMEEAMGRYNERKKE